MTNARRGPAWAWRIQDQLDPHGSRLLLLGFLAIASTVFLWHAAGHIVAWAFSTHPTAIERGPSVVRTWIVLAWIGGLSLGGLIRT